MSLLRGGNFFGDGFYGTVVGDKVGGKAPKQINSRIVTKLEDKESPEDTLTMDENCNTQRKVTNHNGETQDTQG